jgi:hypothetical protein
MIKFALRCANSHDFESWFASGAAYDSLRKAGQVTCPVCDTAQVDKALMAPAVTSATAPKTVPDDTPTRIAKLREMVEANSEHVGPRFAEEARAMYLGDVPNRPIHGEARLDEARALIEDGIPVLPLPFRPKSSTN